MAVEAAAGKAREVEHAFCNGYHILIVALEATC